MLTLTEAAVTAIRNLAAQPDVPDDAGVRIAPQAEDVSSLALTLSENPASTDEVIETRGARVFLEPTAASALEDKVLDAQIDEQGGISFLVGQQPD